jgi:hypothetical protein
MSMNPKVEVGILAGEDLAGAKLWGLILLRLTHPPPPGADIVAGLPGESIKGGVVALLARGLGGLQWWAERAAGGG